MDLSDRLAELEQRYERLQGEMASPDVARDHDRLRRLGKDLSELASALVTYPQILLNVRVRERADYMKVPAIADCIRLVEGQVDGHGRVLIRYSGTEPLLRIMIEGKDDAQIKGWAEEIAAAVRAHLA